MTRTAVSSAALPLSFEPNLGQTDSQVTFLARGAGYTLFLTRTDAVLALVKRQPRPTLGTTALPTAPSLWSFDPGVTVEQTVRLHLMGTNAQPAPVGLDKLPGVSNYFRGHDTRRWHTGIPTYGRVAYRGIYPGIDLIYHGAQGHLEYDFDLAPGADAQAIRLSIEGIQGLHIDQSGNLLLHNAVGDVVQAQPLVYQDDGGTHRLIVGRYVLRGARQVGFMIGAYDHHKPLVIDPTLSYSTYLGGSNTDRGYGIAVDGSGNAYVTGVTFSADFPLASAYQSTCKPSFLCWDAFVTKLNSSGSALVYSTFLGGSNTEQGNGIAVDSSGNAYVTGQTTSSDFPVTSGAYQTTYKGGNGDGFVAKLSSSGGLSYGTYLGGSGYDLATGIAVDSSGNAYVTGLTNSTNFPTVSAYQGSNAGGSYDAFVTKLNSGGSALVYSTYLGGSGDDEGNAIAVDSSGNAYVTGRTQSVDFPRAVPVQNVYGGGNYDAFVTKLVWSGSALSLGYSSYLGGSNDDEGNGIAVDSSNNAYVAGVSSSTDFPWAPAAGPFQKSNDGGTDAFISRLHSDGSTLDYSSYLGGGGNDQGIGIAVDSSGNAYVTGWTNSGDFPTSSAFQSSYGGNPYDAFVAKLNTGTSGASSLVYSSYLGGNADDEGRSLALSGSSAYVTGWTSSTTFPLQSAYQGSCGGCTNGYYDAFVTKVS